jgi:hypothetical protein
MLLSLKSSLAVMLALGLSANLLAATAADQGHAVQGAIAHVHAKNHTVVVTVADEATPSPQPGQQPTPKQQAQQPQKPERTIVFLVTDKTKIVAGEKKKSRKKNPQEKAAEPGDQAAKSTPAVENADTVCKKLRVKMVVNVVYADIKACEPAPQKQSPAQPGQAKQEPAKPAPAQQPSQSPPSPKHAKKAVQADFEAVEIRIVSRPKKDKPEPKTPVDPKKPAEPKASADPKPAPEAAKAPSK